jgi:hypothetical protein
MSDETETTETEDLSGLKNLVAKLRKQTDDLTKKLKAYDGIDPDKARAAEKTLQEQLDYAKSQLEETKSQYEKDMATLKQQLTHKDINFAFGDALVAAKVLPEYRDRFNDISSNLEYRDGALWQGGKPFDPKTLRDKYPAMFAAEVQANGGAAPGAGNGKVEQVRSVKASDVAAIEALNPADVASGKVVITMD